MTFRLLCLEGRQEFDVIGKYLVVELVPVVAAILFGDEQVGINKQVNMVRYGGLGQVDIINNTGALHGFLLFYHFNDLEAVWIAQGF